MNKSTITRYSASAGSGKTYALAKEFIAHLYERGDSYKHILLVTFTNKAATELRYRVLDELSAIASGKQTAMAADLKRMLPKYDERTLCDKAKQLLSDILNDYSHFSVYTIDGFFQKIFKNFTREIGVAPNFNLYVDYKYLLQEAISELIKNLEAKEAIHNWFVEFAQEEFEEGRRINFQEALFKRSEVLFQERYKLLSESEKKHLSDLDGIKKFIDTMLKFDREFVEECKRLSAEIVDIFKKYHVETAHLAHGQTGIYPALLKFCNGEIDNGFNNTIHKNVSNNKWQSSNCSNKEGVEAALNEGVGDRAKNLIEYYDHNKKYYFTNKFILKTIRLAALLEKIKEKLHQKIGEENSYILADTGDFLMQLIGGDQTPFIYEKIGTRYDIYMIDEFQDTSYIQYKNFLPLLSESIAAGEQSLIVGDVKQSIYRWRNGDWSILAQKVPNDFNGRIIDKQLNTNWRSLSEIVKFNNLIFSTIPLYFDARLQNEGIDTSKFSLTNIYNNVIQTIPSNREGGYVRMEIVQPSENDDEDGLPKQMVLKKLPKIIEECEDLGYSASDIAILVRSGKEGTEIIEFLSNYAASLPDNSKYNFNVISSSTLSIGSSCVAKFVINAMQRVSAPDYELNNLAMLRNYLLLKEIDASQFSILDFHKLEQDYFPPNFEKFLLSLQSKPLFEISELIIDYFAINSPQSATILSSLQDQILQYMNDNGSNIADFVTWWSVEGASNPVSLSGEQDGINLMTIHKSKGLQFKVVIIPFITWEVKSKHDTLIWGSTDKEPYSSIAVWPLLFQSDLKKTFFADHYFKEVQESYLDALNMLYVAFTRAKERLYGFTYNNNKSPFCQIISNILSSNSATKENFESNNNTLYEQGISTTNNSKVESGGTLVPFEYNVFSYNDRLRLRLKGENIGSRRVYGTVLHEILSKVKYIEDIDNAVLDTINMGLLARNKKDEISLMLKNRIIADNMEHWFSHDIAEIITEAEIITGRGDIKRPDRIIIRNGKVSILDYKFGKERKSYQYQIDEYRNLLESMGYSVEEAKIWYIAD